MAFFLTACAYRSNGRGAAVDWEESDCPLRGNVDWPPLSKLTIPSPTETAFGSSSSSVRDAWLVLHQSGAQRWPTM